MTHPAIAEMLAKRGIRPGEIKSNYEIIDDRLHQRIDAPMNWHADKVGRDPWTGASLAVSEASKAAAIERPDSTARSAELAAKRERLFARKASFDDVVDLTLDPIVGGIAADMVGDRLMGELVVELANSARDVEAQRQIELAINGSLDRFGTRAGPRPEDTLNRALETERRDQTGSIDL
jgi:hypothetical protein